MQRNNVYLAVFTAQHNCHISLMLFCPTRFLIDDGEYRKSNREQRTEKTEDRIEKKKQIIKNEE